MARGFDSKSVESQQADAFGAIPKSAAAEDPARAATRKKLELARADLRRRFEQAPDGPLMRSLVQALASVESELDTLGGAEDA